MVRQGMKEERSEDKRKRKERLKTDLIKMVLVVSQPNNKGRNVLKGVT